MLTMPPEIVTLLQDQGITVIETETLDDVLVVAVAPRILDRVDEVQKPYLLGIPDVDDPIGRHRRQAVTFGDLSRVSRPFRNRVDQ